MQACDKEGCYIGDLNKAKVLNALYMRARTQGMGFLHHIPGDSLSTEDAERLLIEHDYRFDYLRGRVMKVKLSGDSFRTWAYNRDNGEEAAEKVIEILRAQLEEEPPPYEEEKPPAYSPRPKRRRKCTIL